MPAVAQPVGVAAQAVRLERRVGAERPGGLGHPAQVRRSEHRARSSSERMAASRAPVPSELLVAYLAT